MRISALLVLLLLSGCGGYPPEPDNELPSSITTACDDNGYEVYVLKDDQGVVIDVESTGRRCSEGA